MLYQQMVTFNRIVEVGSFTRAAELLNLSQPAVTRQIAALEADMGGPLIERRGRHLHLTPRGQVVLECARQMEGLVENCKNRVTAITHSITQGEIAIACVTTTGLFTLPGLMARFSVDHPKVRFRLWSGRMDGVIDRLLAAEADLGLVTMPVTDRRLESTPLFRDRVILVAAADQAARLPSPLPAIDLAEIDMIAYEAPSRFRTFVDALLEQAGIYPRVAMELESHEAVKTMVRMGYGVAMVPESAVVAELRSGVLQEINMEGIPEASRTTCMVVRKESSPGPAVKAFVDLILQRFRSYPGPAPLTEPFDAQTEG